MADVATLGGVPIPAGHASVRVSCAPTYAMSHRWSWPNADGVMRCACGRIPGSGPESSERYACTVHCPMIARAQAEGLEDYQGFRDLVYDTVEAERQRCERLGVEWVGPDVQAPPSIQALEARGVDPFDIGCAMRDYGRQHGIQHVWSHLCNEYVWTGDEARRRQDLADVEMMHAEDRLEGRREDIEPGEPYDGGIVRLGCELREADGITGEDGILSVLVEYVRKGVSVTDFARLVDRGLAYPQPKGMLTEYGGRILSAVLKARETDGATAKVDR